MFSVAEIESDVKRVLGACDDAEFYSRLNHAVEVLSTESDWNPLLGYVDLCVSSDRMATLPREVGTVLAVTIDGSPAQAHDFWFKYHLNGAGAKFSNVGYHWVDGLPVPTYLDPDPVNGSQLAVTTENSLDNGKAFRVFGYDVSGNWIRSREGNETVDGFLIPLQYGATTTNSSAPRIKRITRISKPITKGLVNLFTVTVDGYTRIGQYLPTDTEPSYRRIQISKPCSWVRAAFRKASVELSRQSDLIPLHSKYAVVLMCKALKKMDEDRIEEAAQYQQMAIRLLTKKQESVDVPSAPSVQISNGNLIADRGDRME